MTVTSEVARNDYVGTGSLATYAFTFPILHEDDLAVYRAGTLLTRGADYTVALNATTRVGTITLTAGNLANSVLLALVPAADLTQEVNFEASNLYRSSVVGRAVDRLLMQVRQVQEEVRHAIRLPMSESINALIGSSPTARALKALTFNSVGVPVLTEPGSGGSSGSSSIGLNITDFGAVGDGVLRLLTAEQAAEMNGLYGAYGAQGAYAFVAGDPLDWAATQAALWKAANTGERVYGRRGLFRMGSKTLKLEWTSTPIAGQPARPILAAFGGIGHDSTEFAWNNLAAGQPCIELLGISNPYAVRTHLHDMRVYQYADCDATAVCLRVGDCKETFSMFRVFLEGANGMKLKIASSSSYAQLCTHFVECKFDANYGVQWTQAGGSYYAVIPESGGALWDNVLFDSCLFGGVVYTRAALATFFNCQFYSNAQRVSPYSSCIYSPLGSVRVRDSYFEDYRIAIMLTNALSDFRSAVIDGNQFSATKNDAAAPLPEFAVRFIGFGVFKVGMISITNNQMNYAAPSGTFNQVNGHHSGTETSPGVWNQDDVDVSGCRVFMANNTNLYDCTKGILVDDDGAYIFNHSPGDENVGETLLHKLRIRTASAFEGAVTATGLVTGGNMRVPRTGSGDGAGVTWGHTVEIAGTGDSLSFGWSSTVYQPNGAVEWLGNDMGYLYVPPGKEMRWGVGVGASAYVSLSSAGLQAIGMDFAARNMKRGSADPNGVLAGNPGDWMVNVLGAPARTFWVKESGTGNTGWVTLGANRTLCVSRTFPQHANSSIETAIIGSPGAARGSYTIPAGMIRNCDQLRVRITGRLKAIANTNTLRLRLKLGATTEIDTGAVVMAPGGACESGFTLEFTAIPDAAGLTYDKSFCFRYIEAAAADPQVGTERVWRTTKEVAGADLSVDQAMDLTAQFNASDPTIWIQVDTVVLERVTL